MHDSPVNLDMVMLSRKELNMYTSHHGQCNINFFRSDTFRISHLHLLSLAQHYANSYF
jgi:hypothetical protein